MITAHRKNHTKQHLSKESKRDMGLKALKGNFKISDIAQQHHCSRTTVYAQKEKVLSAVNQAFEEDDSEVLYHIPVTKAFIKQVVLSLFLICQSSYRNIIFFLQSIFDYSLSLGSVFNIIDSAAETAKRINDDYDLSPIKTSAADEIFHRNKPTLAVVDVDSRYCAMLKNADTRDHEAWGIHLLDIQPQGYAPDVTIMDSAKGLIKGHEEVMPNTIRRHDHFHMIKDLKDCSRFLKNREASSITAVLKIMKKVDKARDEITRQRQQKALAIAMDELEVLEGVRRQFNCLSQWLQFDILQLAGSEPETRAMLYDFILDEMYVLAQIYPHRISSIVTSLKTQRDALLDVAHTINIEFEKLANIYHQPIERLWDICYAMRYSIDHHFYHEKTTEIEALVGECYDDLEDQILSILGSTHRCSSMVENLNSRLRPYLDEQKQVTQKTLDLLQFYLNHKPFMRSHHEHLKNKTPAQAMSGIMHPHWLDMLGYTPFKRKSV